ncbi:MAG: type III-A CRISPR-associated protein Csm2 [Fusobacteriaceae bacterium]|jgi:CRISPR-associated protein Csm2|nr:type III-A CRISPR-associated protein Csm2 [Fusobacteriaceae bacterium]
MENKQSIQELTEENYVELAEKVIMELKKEDPIKRKIPQQITTSKIRGLLSSISDIYNDVMVGDAQDLTGKLQYLKVQFVYESGREKVTKNFVEKANILNYLNRINRENRLDDKKKIFLIFEKYMEALVAYHKYYGGE